jgi:hypothetical protein
MYTVVRMQILPGVVVLPYNSSTQEAKDQELELSPGGKKINQSIKVKTCM